MLPECAVVFVNEVLDPVPLSCPPCTRRLPIRSKGMLAGSTGLINSLLLARARLSNLAFSTDGSPSLRLVLSGSKGGGGCDDRKYNVF